MHRALLYILQIFTVNTVLTTEPCEQWRRAKSWGPLTKQNSDALTKKLLKYIIRTQKLSIFTTPALLYPRPTP